MPSFLPAHGDPTAVVNMNYRHGMANIHGTRVHTVTFRGGARQVAACRVEVAGRHGRRVGPRVSREGEVLLLAIPVHGATFALILPHDQAGYRQAVPGNEAIHQPRSRQVKHPRDETPVMGLAEDMGEGPLPGENPAVRQYELHRGHAGIERDHGGQRRPFVVLAGQGLDRFSRDVLFHPAACALAQGARPIVE